MKKQIDEVTKIPKGKQKMGPWLSGKTETGNYKVVEVPITSLKPNPKNPRTITESQMQALKNSINKFGFLSPIVVNQKTMTVVSGHQRIEAYKSLGRTTIPTVFVNLTDTEEKALNIGMNRISGKFNTPELADFIVEIKDIDELIKTTGLESKEIEQILAEIKSTQAAKDAIGDVVIEKPKTPDTWQIPKVYQMGKHRLLWGDCTNPEHYKLLMGSTKADMIWTDPPYGIAYKAHKSKQAGKIGIEILNDDPSKIRFDVLLQGFVQNAKAYSKDAAAWYICFGYTTVEMLKKVLKKSDLEIKTYIIWVKNKATFGLVDHYMHIYELILYVTRKKQYPYFAPLIKDVERPDESKQDVWTVKKVNTQKMMHPNEKPVELIKIAIENSSRIGEAVLDPFAGSGSALEACIQTERVFYGSELDPRHIETILNRYTQLTGKEPECLK